MFLRPPARTAFLLLCAIVMALPPAIAQSTLRLASYNLLNYGNSANNSPTKNAHLRTVLQHINPDLAGFNEIYPSAFGGTVYQRIADSVLPASAGPWARGAMHNTNGETQTNMLYFRQQALRLKKDSAICHYLRDIVAYDLYYAAPDLGIYHDTISLTVIVAHLKAGNTSQDRADRAQEAQCISNYMAAHPGYRNFILMGDLNLYSASEQAYQVLTQNPDERIRLHDPLGRPGSWNSNDTFAGIHTQSPRLVSIGDGGVTGGLDSRFDFILVSLPVLNNTSGVGFLPGTYRVTGNDGLHFNKAITDAPANTSVPPGVLQALYAGSDHLPVSADFRFTPPHLGTEDYALLQAEVMNPVRDQVWIRTGRPPGIAQLQYRLISLQGTLLASGKLETSDEWQPLAVHTALPEGMYLLQLSADNGAAQTLKLLRW